MEEPHQFIELGGKAPPPRSPTPQIPISEFEFEDATNNFPTGQTLSLDKLTPEDRSSFYFLTLLYFVQGIPVGLAFGSVPYLLKERLSYSQVGLFTFASYPYSLKLLWSPIVDGIYSRKLGRRRSWIIPIQLLSSVLLIILSKKVTFLMENAQHRLPTLTFMFGLLIFACATQDIAVDGWALTLLSKPALPYASTAQTIGMNAGYFTSFTVFLALSSPEFANKYIRKIPDHQNGLISLSGYLSWCALVYFIATLIVILRRKPDPRQSALEESNIKAIYQNMLRVLKLGNMKTLVVIHLVAKIAFQAAETVTNLKLLERGLSKEDLALVVLIDFPFEVFFGYYAAKWSSGRQPLRPWLWAYVLRLVFACISMSQVYYFPQNGVSQMYLSYVVLVHVLGSFLSTVQFVSITAFHTQIADPEIGGTYMTVLNTLCNLGGQWPRALVLAGVDTFTEAYCTIDQSSCVSQESKLLCKSRGGTCVIKHDGYYFMNIVCVAVGIVLFTTFINKAMKRLQALPPQAWRNAS